MASLNDRIRKNFVALRAGVDIGKGREKSG
jgi:hypothetical protein